MDIKSLKYRITVKITNVKLVIILMLFFWCPTNICKGQVTDGTLGVHHYEEKISHPQLFKLLERSQPDTARVGILIKISSIYWRKGTLNDLDSCTFFAKKALNLSRQLKYIKGSNEALFLECKSFTAKNDLNDARTLLASVYGEMKVRLLLVISEYYVFLPEQRSVNLDTAYTYMTQARKLSNALHSIYWDRYCHLLFAKYYFERGAYDSGKSEMFDIIDGYKKAGDVYWEAYYWSELGLYLPRSERAYRDKLYSHQMAIKLFSSIHKTKDAVYSLRDLAELNFDYHHFDLAEKQMSRVLAIHDSINLKPTFITNFLEAQILTANGQFAKGLSYLLTALKIVNPEDRYQQMWGFSLLANIYFAQGLYERSLYYNKLVLDYCLSENKFSTYTYVHKIVLNHIKLGNATGALSFLNSFNKKHPPVYLNDMELMALSYGNVYSELKLYSRAELSFLQMIRFGNQLTSEPSRELQHLSDNDRLSSSEAYFTIGNFYVERKRYEDARPYLVQALKNNNTEILDVAGQGNIELQLYKIDSAERKYLPALQHFNQYHYIKDSVLRVTKNKEFQELQLQFETKQKEQSIKFLLSQSKHQTRELHALNSERQLIIAAVIMLLLIATLSFLGYRNKQSSNRKLRSKQEEINQQNLLLQTLLKDKDGLLWEKELLLTELQHRVKNNLQVVIGLLNKQSGFIRNKEALAEVQESKNRIQAMALIHQKFYSVPIIGSVNMKQYIYELINYLEYSFGIKQHKIKIQQIVEVETLNISQVLPIGLILNEVITNSIKHAFEPDGTGGWILVTLKPLNEEEIELAIADNGKGLPADFEVKRGMTLGLEILIDLSKQLGADLIIKSENGTVISVRFKKFGKPKEHITQYLLNNLPPGD